MEQKSHLGIVLLINIVYIIEIGILRDSLVGANRMLRGGSWKNGDNNSRVNDRNGWNKPTNASENIGFRVLLIQKGSRRHFMTKGSFKSRKILDNTL